ncbi:MAG: hypothetical protein KF773_16870, partial [Deltaproteobacteria bacterium]|nr:hypothetical protein [Deltaproteobacteria bacterium]
MKPPSSRSALPASIALSSDGSRVVLRSAQGVHVLGATQTIEPVFIPATSVIDLAIARGDVWIVEGDQERAVLRRFTLGGSPVGEPERLEGAPCGARLVVAPSAACAAWNARPVAIAGLADREPRAVPGDPDFALPISPTRWVVCQRGRVALREPTFERWRSDDII